MSISKTFRIRPTRGAGIASIAACLLLTGCFDVPDFRNGGRLSSPFSRTAPAPADPMAPDVPQASAAETACMEAGRQAGFDVQGVVGTSEVIGTGGLPESRDVMLRIQRSGQTVEVRCRFAYINGTAQIMTL